MRNHAKLFLIASVIVLEGRGPFGKKKGTGTACLSGVVAALDAEQEWRQADGQLYFIPPKGVDPNKRLVEVTRRRWVLRFILTRPSRSIIVFESAREGRELETIWEIPVKK